MPLGQDAGSVRFVGNSVTNYKFKVGLLNYDGSSWVTGTFTVSIDYY